MHGQIQDVLKVGCWTLLLRPWGIWELGIPGAPCLLPSQCSAYCSCSSQCLLALLSLLQLLLPASTPRDEAVQQHG